MRTPRGEDGRGPHADEEALHAVVAGVADDRVRRHVETCALCAERVAELGVTRRLLRALAAHEAAPRLDLARGAVQRIRLRAAAVAELNELLATLRAIAGGITTLLFGRAQIRSEGVPGGNSPEPDGGDRG